MQWIVNRRIQGLALICVVSLVFMATIFTTEARAAEYDETNPVMLEAVIDAKESWNLATSAYANFTQAGGRYTIDTNSYVFWGLKDDVALLYREYAIGSSSTDTLKIEATIESQEPTHPVGDDGSENSLDKAASTGLFMRSSLDPGAASIFLHVRKDHIVVVYRTMDGGETLVRWADAAPMFPVRFRIEKIGNKYACSYQNNGMPWITFATVGCNISGPLLAGMAAHSTDRNIAIYSQFSDYTAVGSGIVTDTGGGETSETGTTTTMPSVEDPPYGDDTLLFETFTDGSMTEGEEAVNNPIWDESKNHEIVLDSDGNRRWYKSFAEGQDFIGDETWTDYSMSVEFEITEATDSQANDRLIFWVRHKGIVYYGYYGIGIALETVQSASTGQTTTYMNLYYKFRTGADSIGTKIDASSKEIGNLIGTGKHTLYVECMDNKTTVYLDGEYITKYVDNGVSPALYGNIGFETTANIDVLFDDILVKKLEDPHGGDYDNAIGANYDDDVPGYVQSFEQQYGAP